LVPPDLPVPKESKVKLELKDPRDLLALLAPDSPSRDKCLPWVTFPLVPRLVRHTRWLRTATSTSSMAHSGTIRVQFKDPKVCKAPWDPLDLKDLRARPELPEPKDPLAQPDPRDLKDLLARPEPQEPRVIPEPLDLSAHKDPKDYKDSQDLLALQAR
jgi:hypothetical protein